jgi:hypothetical protein
MKGTRRFVAATMVGAVMALVPASASAHPGNTDAAGGHRCYTNCPSYGLTYGQYHFHNQGSAAGSTGAGSAGSSVITQADCNAGRIRRGGRTLSRAQCQRLIGQRVNLAGTGFEAWILFVAGGACMLEAVALRRSKPRGGTTA